VLGGSMKTSRTSLNKWVFPIIKGKTKTKWMDEDHGKPLIKNGMIWVKKHYFWGNIQVYHAKG